MGKFLWSYSKLLHNTHKKSASKPADYKINQLVRFTIHFSFTVSPSQYLSQRALAFPSWWWAKWSTNPVPESEELAVVIVIEQVVVGVVGWAINEWSKKIGNAVISIMNGYRPQVDEDKE